MSFAVAFSSPFTPIKYWIKTFQVFGGWPLKTTNNARNFSKTYLFLPLIFIPFLCIIGSLILVEAKDKDLAFNVGDKTDTLSLLKEVPSVIAFFFNLIVVLEFGPALTEFCQHFDGVQDLLLNKKKMKRKMRIGKSLVLLFATFALVSCLLELWPFIFFSVAEWWVQLLSVIFEFFVVSFLEIPALTLLLHLMFYQGIAYLTTMLESLSEFTESQIKLVISIPTLDDSKRNKETQKVPVTAEWIINKSNKLFILVKLFNDLFGFFVFWEIGACFIKTVAFIYQAVSIFSELGVDGKLHDTYLGLQPFFYFTRMAALLLMGESMTKSILKLEDNLQDFTVVTYNLIPEKSKLAFKTIIASIAKMEIPLRPLNGFDLCLSNLLHATSMLITYIIVLVQFKAQELSCGLVSITNQTLNEAIFNATEVY